MRQMISGLIGAAAFVVAGAAPAMACGGGGLFTSGCSPCASPCGQGYGSSYDYSGYYGAGYERLPSPTQYYYVNQGPTYTGPGNFAPLPSYQESAVSGWNAYSRPYYYGYDGGRYANATHHYYDGAPVGGPAIYSYRWRHSYRHHRHQRPYYGMHRHSVRYGYAPRHYGHHFAAGPRVVYGSRHYGYGAHYGHRHQVLRRYH